MGEEQELRERIAKAIHKSHCRYGPPNGCPHPEHHAEAARYADAVLSLLEEERQQAERLREHNEILSAVHVADCDELVRLREELAVVTRERDAERESVRRLLLIVDERSEREAVLLGIIDHMVIEGWKPQRVGDEWWWLVDSNLVRRVDPAEAAFFAKVSE